MLSQTNDPVKIIKTTDAFATAPITLTLPNDKDGGISAEDFTRGQSFYDLMLDSDPNNPDHIYVGGIDIFKSTTGGVSSDPNVNPWDQVSHWYGGFSEQYIHADQHAMTFGNSDSTKKLFGNESLLYSEIDLKKPIPKVLIVDQIGILADLYNYSDIAFIGGGFSGKLHNILEAAAKGNFLLFGPNIDKYPEANLMLKEEIAETIHASKDLKKIILKLIGNKAELEKKKKKAKQIIKENKGATEIVWNEIQKLV